jgi:hypothetical protein
MIADPGRGRVAAPLVLLVLAPLVAEFLIGDFTLRQIGFILIFIPQYGGGALLVREAGRRIGGRWPTLALFAVAYALVEEGFTTQTLFNPDYAGQRLLDFGYIPALGTSLDWTLFVLTLHVAWSIGSAVAISESIAGTRSSSPWLRTRGLVATAVLYLLGCWMTTAITLRMFPYVASLAQFAAIGAAVLVVIVVGIAVARRHGARTSGQAPRPWLVAAMTLALGRAFHFLFDHGLPTREHPALTLAGMIGLEIIAVVALLQWSRREGWSARHALGAAVGAILAYGWLSVQRFAAGRTALGVPTTGVDVASQVALLAAILGIAVIGARRLEQDGGTTERS